MDRQQIGLKLALDALDRTLDLSSFGHRLILQKTVYLAQACGVDLGYDFHWYLRGPYSPALTRDAFAVKAELGLNAEDLRDWKLDPRSHARLATLRNLMPTDENTSSLSKRLELLASVHFVVSTRQAKVSDPAGVESVLRRSKKEFTVAEVTQAIQDLTTHELLAPGT
jgi:hypothetical protein